MLTAPCVQWVRAVAQEQALRTYPQELHVLKTNGVDLVKLDTVHQELMVDLRLVRLVLTSACFAHLDITALVQSPTQAALYLFLLPLESTLLSVVFLKRAPSSSVPPASSAKTQECLFTRDLTARLGTFVQLDPRLRQKSAAPKAHGPTDKV